jgi:hypothetical protein
MWIRLNKPTCLLPTEKCIHACHHHLSSIRPGHIVTKRQDQFTLSLMGPGFNHAMIQVNLVFGRKYTFCNKVKGNIKVAL